MKLPILHTNGKTQGEYVLPDVCSEPYRPDLIRRAVLALHSTQRQRYGAYPLAGKRHSSSVSKRRRDYRGCYGFGISRVARKILSRRGTRIFWVGTFTPQTVGGRRAHPPKASKIYAQKINDKERRKAIRSAISATFNKELVVARGHNVPDSFPFVLDASLEQLTKTKDILATLEQAGFVPELERAEQKKVRAGKGKLRGRKYRRKKSVLFVVSQDCPLMRAARNITGVEVVEVASLNARLLAPGALAGRVALWTTSALDVLAKKEVSRI